MKDFINSLNDRVKSPFYWAFIFSWIIVNWKIPILIFDFEHSGCSGNIIKCINENVSLYSLILYPLLGASIYIFLVGFIDVEITKFTEKMKSRKTEIKFSPDKVLSAEFVALKLKEIDEEKSMFKKTRESFDSITNLLKSENTKKQDTIENLERDKNQLAKTVEEYKNKIDYYNIRNDLSRNLAGDWSFEIRDDSSRPFKEERVIYFNTDYINTRRKDNNGQSYIKTIWSEVYNNKIRILGINQETFNWVYWELESIHKFSLSYEGYITMLNNGTENSPKLEVRITSQKRIPE